MENKISIKELCGTCHGEKKADSVLENLLLGSCSKSESKLENVVVGHFNGNNLSKDGSNLENSVVGDSNAAPTSFDAFPLLRKDDKKVDGSIHSPVASTAGGWKHLFKSNISNMEMEFIEPTLSSGGTKIKVTLPKEVADIGSSKWSTSIVGFFLGKRIPFSVMKSYVDKVWKKFGHVAVISNGFGGFIFKFHDESNRNAVLEGGPWHVAGQPIFLKKWSPNLNMAKEGFKKIPMWIKIYGIPLEFWSSKGLSMVASAIGKPLYMDTITEKCERLEFAKICVEIESSSTFPDRVELELPNGDLIDVIIEYAWKPITCTWCKTFGHSLSSCRVAPIDSKPNSQPRGGVQKNHAKDQVWKQTSKKVPQSNAIGVSNPAITVLNNSFEVLNGSDEEPLVEQANMVKGLENETIIDVTPSGMHEGIHVGTEKTKNEQNVAKVESIGVLEGKEMIKIVEDSRRIEPNGGESYGSGKKGGASSRHESCIRRMEIGPKNETCVMGVISREGNPCTESTKGEEDKEEGEMESPAIQPFGNLKKVDEFEKRLKEDQYLGGKKNNRAASRGGKKNPFPNHNG